VGRCGRIPPVLAPSELRHNAPGLKRGQATYVLEVLIHMPQHEIAGDGRLRAHHIRQRDGHPLPAQGIAQAGHRFPELRGERDLRQDPQGVAELGHTGLIPRPDEELGGDDPAGIHRFCTEGLLDRRLEVPPPV
jgi:hypothetical protein